MATNLDEKYRTLLILWFGMAISVVTLFLITLFVAPERTSADRDAPTGVVLFVMAAIGSFMVVVSFAVKRKILQRSVEMQDVTLVQQALVLGCAMCEVPALIGLVERFVIASGDHYLLFLASAIGLAIHFPRRDHLLAASWNDETRRQL